MTDQPTNFIFGHPVFIGSPRLKIENLPVNKTQGFRVELQVSGGGVTGKGQDNGQDRDKIGTR